MAECRRCLFDDTVKGISFDARGVCSFCRLQEKMRAERARADGGELLARIARRGRHREYDCVVPFSGGLDSSYVLYSVKKAGLRPIAVHTDNGWVTDLATRNMAIMTAALGVPLVRITQDWDVLRSGYRAFLEASVPELCSVCEVASLSGLLSFAARHRIPDVLFGYSPETDGFAPLDWHYVDGRYFDSVVERFSDRPGDLKRLNRTRFSNLLRFALVDGIRCIQFPRYVPWDEEAIRRVLSRELGWTDGGRHSDCAFHPFLTYVQRRKFGIVKIKTYLAARINAGLMTREDAQAMVRATEPGDGDGAFGPVLERLALSPADFDRLMARAPRDFTAFPTGYPVLRRLKPLLRAGCRLGLFTTGLYEHLFETGGASGRGPVPRSLP